MSSKRCGTRYRRCVRTLGSLSFHNIVSVFENDHYIFTLLFADRTFDAQLHLVKQLYLIENLKSIPLRYFYFDHKTFILFAKVSASS